MQTLTPTLSWHFSPVPQVTSWMQRTAFQLEGGTIYALLPGVFPQVPMRLSADIATMDTNATICLMLGTTNGGLKSAIDCGHKMGGKTDSWRRLAIELFPGIIRVIADGASMSFAAPPGQCKLGLMIYSSLPGYFRPLQIEAATDFAGPEDLLLPDAAGGLHKAGNIGCRQTYQIDEDDMAVLGCGLSDYLVARADGDQTGVLRSLVGASYCLTFYDCKIPVVS